MYNQIFTSVVGILQFQIREMQYGDAGSSPWLLKPSSPVTHMQSSPPPAAPALFHIHAVLGTSQSNALRET